jgi:integrase
MVRDEFLKGAKWTNAKHADQWRWSLETYATPIIGGMVVGTIDKWAVKRVLDPIWQKIPPTARRVRERIEAILHFAKSHGYRTGDNPGEWKGCLQDLMPELPPIDEGEEPHHEAIPYADMPNFMRTLERHHGIAPLALRFLVLTAARSREVREMEWREVDFDAACRRTPSQAN